MNWSETKAFLSPCFPDAVREALDRLPPAALREIRIRAFRPAALCTAEGMHSVSWSPDAQAVHTLAEALTCHSLYARGSESSQGYVTLQGGHRMGLCGSWQEKGMQHLGSLCIRIAGEWPGAADELAHLCTGGRSMLIIGPPGSGKTTMLRDLARQLSTGAHAVHTALVDERGELAACMKGVPQLNVGDHCDVLDGCPKAQAVPYLVRAMAPQLIITDELAGDADAQALLDATACGVAVIASVHGTGITQAASKPALASLMARRVFDHYAVLAPQGGGKVLAVYDRNGQPVKR